MALDHEPTKPKISKQAAAAASAATSSAGGAIMAHCRRLYLLFPDNLALLTRIIAIALLVLSLDLVTGYCGVATLGHAALFGSGAYAAGILSARIMASTIRF
jgi:branched-chain amino acid transport system permease protein